jgi:hypothetical protein
MHTQGLKSKSLLTTEEKILFDILSKNIEEWRDFFTKF